MENNLISSTTPINQVSEEVFCNTMKAVWLEACSQLQVRKEDWPDAAQWEALTPALLKIRERVRLYTIAEVLSCLRYGINMLGISNAEKGAFPRWTVGHAQSILFRPGALKFLDRGENKQLSSDGMTPEQRAAEEAWNGDPQEVAKVKVPKLLESIDYLCTLDPGSSLRLGVVIGLGRNRPKFMQHLIDSLADKGKIEQVIEETYHAWRLEMIDAGTPKHFFRKDGKKVKPRQVREKARDYLLMKGKREDGHKLPDYELNVTEALLRAYSIHILQAQREEVQQ